jgi:hypothetical protein
MAVFGRGCGNDFLIVPATCAKEDSQIVIEKASFDGFSILSLDQFNEGACIDRGDKTANIAVGALEDLFADYLQTTPFSLTSACADIPN